MIKASFEISDGCIENPGNFSHRCAPFIGLKANTLARWIGEASGNRRRMLDTAYEDAGALHRLRVHIPDRPGVLAGIFQALGAERINVSDFELEHLSPERGGTLTVLVTGEDDAAQAVSLLESQGYGVVLAPVLDA
jgi:hypothetical protein